MKAITLTEPWAILASLNLKKMETRSWSTSYRGVLAIHAGKGPGKIGWMQMNHICNQTEPFKSALAPILYGRHPGEVLPLGAIVATCELIDCVPTTYVRTVKIIRRGDHEWCWTEQEAAFGDYTQGRFAWLLANVRPLDTPIKVRGALGLWTWNAPAALQT